MKKIIFLILFMVSAFISKSQNALPDKEAIQVLKEFYSAYNTAWSTAKGQVLVKKLDSLQTKYCTSGALKELKKLYKKAGLDHDALTNDQFTDVAHLKTLKIIKDPTKLNLYTVSYITRTLSPANKPIDETVIIHVTVSKENGSFKIADAYGDAIRLK